MEFFLRIREKSIEKKNHRFLAIGNELETISNEAEKTREDLKNIRLQRQKAKAAQEEKELKARHYLDFLRAKLKRSIKKQHSFRYQQELVSIYHGEEEEKYDSDSSNELDVVLPLPFILTKQASLLKCLHLIELQNNQCNMVKNHILKFQDLRSQEKEVVRSVAIPSDDDKNILLLS